MKKIKNKLFYLYSFVIYLFLVICVSLLASKYLTSSINSYLINNFVSIRNGSSNIFEVIIDDDTINNYSPWNRLYELQLLDYFHSYAKPKVVGLDMMMQTFDKTKSIDLAYLNQVSMMDNFVTGFLPSEDLAGDRNVKIDVFKDRYALNVDLKRDDIQSKYVGAQYLEEVSKSTKNLASVVIQPDNGSGTVFSSVSIIKIGDAYYPSLSLKLYLMANNTNDIILDNKYIIVPKTGVKIPYTLSSNGYLNTDIRYYDNIEESDYSHNKISAGTILKTYAALKSGVTPKTNPELYEMKGKIQYINPDIFKDKIIIIGRNVSGPSNDVLKTPMAIRHPGPDIQATLYDNIANNYFLTFPNFAVNLLLVSLLCLVTFVLIFRAKFFKGILSIIGIDFAYFFLIIVFAILGYIIPCSIPFAAQFVTVIFGYSFKFLTENRNKEKIKQAMGKYLSQDIMNNVVSNIDDLKLGGKRAIVTVLFSDIRGFTSLSEKMSAEEVSMILNEYFAEMEPIITKYNGVINKFIGDAVMAIFGEPIQDINHARNAVKCAYEMLKKVEYLREKWLFEGKPKIEIGVGINTGEVFIGNIGTETRMEYTVIGDTVNLASRIESYNKVYKTNLLVSSSTYAHIADIADVIKISEVQIRGKAKKMNIYEVLRIDRDKDK